MSPDKDAAKRVICQILAASGGKLAGKTRLYKAFYFAHLYYWRDNTRFLTDYPIVRMPHGPGIENGDQLVNDLVSEGRIRVTRQPIGPYTEAVYELAQKFEVDPTDPQYLAVEEATQFVKDRTAAELTELTHEYSRSWQNIQSGDELDIYFDLLNDEEYERLKARSAEVRQLVKGVFAPGD